jgi:hypothetical protein
MNETSGVNRADGPNRGDEANWANGDESEVKRIREAKRVERTGANRAEEWIGSWIRAEDLPGSSWYLPA